MVKTPAYQERPSEEAASFTKDLPDYIRAILEKRGITTDIEFAELSIDYKDGIHDPLLLDDAKRVADRIILAAQNGEKIAVYADYDADGVPAGTMLFHFLKKIGAKDPEIYLPHRGNEGFGLNKRAVEELSGKGVTLLITVDCGITDSDEVVHASELGIETIITDHHEPPEKLPPAFAIINPKKKSCKYPYKELCGAGVAYKLIQAIQQDERVSFPEGFEKWYLDLVGVATLADMVPLTGENRVLARYGLTVLGKGRRHGLRELLSRARVPLNHVSEDDVTFTIAPRINAASRMAHPEIAFGLLSAEDRSDATERATLLESINNERKLLVARIVKEVKKTISKDDLPRIVVAGNPHWKPGILGLIASALVDSFGRPAFVWGREPDNGGDLKGSARSDGSVSIVELLRALPDGLLLGCGGHEMSGGFSIALENVSDLSDALNSAAEKDGNLHIEPEDFLYDVEIPAKEISRKHFEDVRELAPFGVGFEKPIFKITNAEIVSAREFGKQKNHLELSFNGARGEALKAIGFFKTRESFERNLEEGETVTIYGALEKSFWRGRPEYRVRIEWVE